MMKMLLIFTIVALGAAGSRLLLVSLELRDTRENLAMQKQEHIREMEALEKAHERELDELHQYLFMASGASGFKAVVPMAAVADVPGADATTGCDLGDFATGIPERMVDQAVEKKYALLLPEMSLTAEEQAALQTLLQTREQVMSQTTASYYTTEDDLQKNLQKQNQQLEEVDERVRALLSEEDYQRYELFKDSGFEQYQLSQFSRRLDVGQELSSEQSRQLLETKLALKQTFSAALAESRQLADSLNGDRVLARRQALAALDQYSEDLFAQASGSLSEAQLAALVEYESAQFSDMRKSLAAGF